MTRNKKILLLVSFCAIVFLILPHFVFAQTVDLANINPLKQYCPGGKCDPAKLIGGIIKAALGIVGSIALLMFLYGGFLWLTSAGNEQKITKGKSVLVWAVIGLAVIFMSYAAVNFVIGALTGSSTTSTSTETIGTCVCTGGGGYSTQSTQTACSAVSATYQPCTWTSGI